MTFTGKRRQCAYCGQELEEKIANHRKRWYTPRGKWHYTNICQFGTNRTYVRNRKPVTLKESQK